MAQVLERHQLVEFFVAQMATWGGAMLFVEDSVCDVRVASVDAQTMNFVADDRFGEGVAAVKLGLHVIENFTTAAELYDYLQEAIYDAMVESYFLDGRTVIIT